MGRTLTISDELYLRLEAAARKHGLTCVEDLLKEWQVAQEDPCSRIEAVKRIDALRARMFATYGEMPDSVALLGEDRKR